MNLARCKRERLASSNLPTELEATLGNYADLVVVSSSVAFGWVKMGRKPRGAEPACPSASGCFLLLPIGALAMGIRRVLVRLTGLLVRFL
jgi:hypothetical protein